MCECNCDLRTKLVGDGCSVCNPDIAKQIEENNQFDDWFNSSGYSEEYYDMFEIVWRAALSRMEKLHGVAFTNDLRRRMNIEITAKAAIKQRAL